MKKIEIFGAGFANKGGELMLRTTVNELRRTQPDLRLAVEARPQDAYEKRAALSLAHIFPSVPLYYGPACRFLFRSEILRRIAFAPARIALPRQAEDQLGLTPRAHCDALVDISGYAFGDGFSWIKSKNAAERCRSYYRQGKPVIFMPQMFGPFKKTKVRDAFRRCCDYATVIYAREQPSYEAVREIIGDDARLKMAPDITIFSASQDASEPNVILPDSPYGCLVPNERMLDQGKAEWSDTYLDRMVGAGVAMAKHGVQPVVLIHAGDGKDGHLAEEVRARLAVKLSQGSPPVFAHADPRALKLFIAGSQFLIGSRFHSLVAALSSSVPGVALGWAHKYDALANDFGVPQLQHRGSDPLVHLTDLVANLSDSAKNNALRKTIKEKKRMMEFESNAMWANVRALLDLPPSADSKLAAS